MSSLDDETAEPTTLQLTIDLATTTTGRQTMHVVLEDGQGKKGGNGRGKGGQMFRWTNSTGRACRLVFKKLVVENNGNLGEEPFWPFYEDPSEQPNVRVIPPSPQQDLNPWRGTLRDAEARIVVKYDIVVDPGSNSQVTLDPMIVVER